MLLEDNVTMVDVEEQGKMYKPCRVELANPDYDWDISWRRITLKGLGPKMTSFLFKVVHQLLPTQERIARTNPRVSSTCKAVGCSGVEIEDVTHALISCVGNDGVGITVLNCVNIHVNGMTDEGAVRLQFNTEDNYEMPVVWVLAVAWSYIWETRALGKKPELFNMRAQLEARVALLRKARKFHNESEAITAIIEGLHL